MLAFLYNPPTYPHLRASKYPALLVSAFFGFPYWTLSIVRGFYTHSVWYTGLSISPLVRFVLMLPLPSRNLISVLLYYMILNAMCRSPCSIVHPNAREKQILVAQSTEIVYPELK